MVEHLVWEWNAERLWWETALATGARLFVEGHRKCKGEPFYWTLAVSWTSGLTRRNTTQFLDSALAKQAAYELWRVGSSISAKDPTFVTKPRQKRKR